jgi:hypothetical protein
VHNNAIARFAAPKQPLHVLIMVPEPEQLFKSHRLARLHRPSDGFDVGQHRAVREFAPRVLLVISQDPVTYAVGGVYKRGVPGLCHAGDIGMRGQG